MHHSRGTHIYTITIPQWKWVTYFAKVGDFVEIGIFKQFVGANLEVLFAGNQEG